MIDESVFSSELIFVKNAYELARNLRTIKLTRCYGKISPTPAFAEAATRRQGRKDLDFN